MRNVGGLLKSLIIIIIIIIIILDPGTSFPGCETLSKVCGVWNGYNGDSEIVKVLDRQTALKRWIAAEICWYRNAVLLLLFF